MLYINNSGLCLAIKICGENYPMAPGDKLEVPSEKAPIIAKRNYSLTLIDGTDALTDYEIETLREVLDKPIDVIPYVICSEE